ncbi:RNA polymerase sigma factor [Nannocystaceae bacterium ST9]
MDTKAPNDEALYASWTRGDTRAGRELIARRFDGVCRLIRSLLSGAEVEDAIQQVFERLANRAARGEPIDNVRAFVAGIARNVVRERLRANFRAPVDLSEQSLVDIHPDQSELILIAEQHNLLLKGLHRLPIDDQILLGLRFWQRLKTRELALVLGLEHATVRSRLRRAKARLEGLIDELIRNGEARNSTIGSIDGWAREIGQRVSGGSRDCA